MDQQRFMNALYLNNAAVTFILRGEYHSAVEACRDALELIKYVVHNKNVASTMRRREFEEMAVQRTMKRLATRFSRVKPASRFLVPVEVLSFDGFLPTNYCLDNWSTARAIVINDIPYDHADVKANGIITAILLSNFALAHLCVSQAESIAATYNASQMNAGIDEALLLLDVGLRALGVYQRTMKVTEGNMFVAITLLGNRCFAMQRDESRPLQCNGLTPILEEIAMLERVSSRLTCSRCPSVPVAGAA